MINFDDVAKENLKEHNTNQLKVSDHPLRILIIEGSESGKTNSLFNTISQQPDIYKTQLNSKDPFEAKYQVLINN